MLKYIFLYIFKKIIADIKIYDANIYYCHLKVKINNCILSKLIKFVIIILKNRFFYNIIYLKFQEKKLIL